MTAQHHQGQSPGAALVLLLAGYLIISGHRPQGLAHLQAIVFGWAVATGTEVLEAVARTQGGAT